MITFSLVILEKIVCFVLGYLTIRLGYLLIASGAKGDFKFGAKLGGLKTDLVSVSPGLLFVLLGSVLIGFAIHVDKGATLKIGAPRADKPPPLSATNNLNADFEPSETNKPNEKGVTE